MGVFDCDHKLNISNPFSVINALGVYLNHDYSNLKFSLLDDFKIHIPNVKSGIIDTIYIVPNDNKSYQEKKNVSYFSTNNNYHIDSYKFSSQHNCRTKYCKPKIEFNFKYLDSFYKAVLLNDYIYTFETDNKYFIYENYVLNDFGGNLGNNAKNEMENKMKNTTIGKRNLKLITQCDILKQTNNGIKN